jgi:predicted Zn-dependent protease
VDSKSWGFSSTNILNRKSIEQTLTSAVKLAKAASGLKKQKTQLKPEHGVVANVTLSAKKLLRDFSAEDIVKIPQEAYEGAREVGPRVADVKATYIGIEDDKYS